MRRPNKETEEIIVIFIYSDKFLSHKQTHVYQGAALKSRDFRFTIIFTPHMMHSLLENKNDVYITLPEIENSLLWRNSERPQWGRQQKPHAKRLINLCNVLI